MTTMIFIKLALILVFSVGCHTSVWAQVHLGKSTETQACDMLPSDPLDQDRPTYSDRIPAQINDAKAAIKVCGAVAANYPDHLRLSGLARLGHVPQAV